MSFLYTSLPSTSNTFSTAVSLISSKLAITEFPFDGFGWMENEFVLEENFTPAIGVAVPVSTEWFLIE